MDICENLKTLSNTVIGLGFFDGVHLGHRKLINQVVKTAKTNNLKSVILTFKKSPAENFCSDVKYLTTNSEKELLINNLNIDYLFELDFNTLINITAYDYLKNIVTNYFNPKYIYTGYNHTFGKDKSGNPKLLLNLSNELNYEYRMIEPVQYLDKTISSTRIKECLKTGNIELANKLLDRPYSIDGIVKEGLHLGTKIGFPTANIDYPANKAQIPHGVYSVSIETNEGNFKGIMNYGIKPTINPEINKPIVEINIFNFNKNIYNKNIKVNILKRIRNEQKFSSLEELKLQIKKDIEQC